MAASNKFNKFTKVYCYGPYIPDSTSTQGGLGKIDSQYTGYRTDGTSEAIGRGVAESYNQSRAAYQIYSRTERVKLSTWDI